MNNSIRGRFENMAQRTIQYKAVEKLACK